MAGLDVMPLSTSAYIADTQHLSNAQHGAYLLLLMAMWRSGGWLPVDERILSNVAKLSKAKWRQIAGPVLALLTEKDGRLTQKRLQIEIRKRLELVSENRKNGYAGGVAKSLKSKEPTLATASNSPAPRQPVATIEKTPPTSLLPSLLPNSNNKQTEQAERKKERVPKNSGAPLADAWQPTSADFDYGMALGFDRKRVTAMAESMRSWAVANAHRPVARKSNWTAAFQGWMRRALDDRHGAGPQRPARRSFMDIAHNGLNGGRHEQPDHDGPAFDLEPDPRDHHPAR